MTIQRKIDQGDVVINRAERELNRKLIQNYRDSSDTILAELRQLYNRFERNGELPFAQVQRFGRLERINKNIRAEMIRLAQVNKTDITGFLKLSLEESYYYAGFALETELQSKLAFEALDTATINQAIQNDFSGLTLNERLQRNRDTTIIQLRETTTRGLTRGDSFRNISQGVATIFEGDRNKAMRVVRTETNRLRNQSRLDAYQRANDRGIEVDKVWITARDDRVRDTHILLDGQVIGTETVFNIRGNSAIAPNQFGVPSEDINCRCRIIGRIRGFDSEAEYRRRQDRRIRESEVIPYDNYADWRRNRLLNKR